MQLIDVIGKKNANIYLIPQIEFWGFVLDLQCFVLENRRKSSLTNQIIRIILTLGNSCDPTEATHFSTEPTRKRLRS